MTRVAALLAALAFALIAAACDRAETATPALWEVTGPNGAHGYLFGTIHALDEDVDWRSDTIDHAFDASDTLAVEAAGVADAQETQRIWNRLGRTPGQKPLTQRVPPEDVPDLEVALKRAGVRDGDFADVETWAAALMLASALRDEHGEAVDLALLHDAKGKRLVDLEGVAGQLAIFDRLPEADQAALLASVGEGEIDDPHGEERLARLWRDGNVEGIAVETRKGMLAEPDLREALLVARNRAWTGRIDALLRSGATPFVAVGAAHMAGADGLPEMLAGQGYQVRRIQ